MPCQHEVSPAAELWHFSGGRRMDFWERCRDDLKPKSGFGPGDTVIPSQLPLYPTGRYTGGQVITQCMLGRAYACGIDPIMFQFISYISAAIFTTTVANVTPQYH